MKQFIAFVALLAGFAVGAQAQPVDWSSVDTKTQKLSLPADKPTAKKPIVKQAVKKPAEKLGAKPVVKQHDLRIVRGHVWRHFGRDRAYKTRAEAIADAPRVFRKAGLPEPVIALFTEAMKKPGKTTRITNGDLLDFMRSDTDELWLNVKVQFDKPPTDKMEYAAPAEEWSVDWKGTTYTVGLPDICFNLNGLHHQMAPTKVVQAPPKVVHVVDKEDCDYHLVEARSGDVSISMGFLGDYQPSKCFAYHYLGSAENADEARRLLRHVISDQNWKPIKCPDYLPCDFERVVKAEHRSVTQTGKIDVAEKLGWYAVGVSRDFANSGPNVAVYCKEMRGNLHSCGINITNTDYHEGIATIFYGLQDIPAPWKWRKLWWDDPSRDDCHDLR